jgi:hypothetical protein
MIKANATLFILLSLFMLLTGSRAPAQNGFSSPYSRYGVGELWSNNYSSVLSPMGNTGIAIRSERFINIKNAASYTAFDSTSFLFDLAGTAMFKTLKSGDISQESDYASLGYILFGTPVTRWWRASFGLIPFSNVGYNVFQDKVIDDIGRTRFTNEGSGGLNQFHVGSGFRITPKLSVGLNASYIWGLIMRRQRVAFPDSLSMISTRVDNIDHVSDFIFNIGVQYFTKVGEEMELGLGAVFTPPMDLNSTRKYIGINYFGGSNNIELSRDTVVYSPSTKGILKFPTGFGAGVSLRKFDQFLVSFDVNWSNWKEFESYGKNDSLQNSYSFHLGGEYIPKHNSISSYWHRVYYRLGFRYENTYLRINNQSITEFGISFGLGLPFKRSKSMVNFALEIGNMGTLKKDLVQENFIKFTFGLTIQERWFIKPKYR